MLSCPRACTQSACSATQRHAEHVQSTLGPRTHVSPTALRFAARGASGTAAAMRGVKICLGPNACPCATERNSVRRPGAEPLLVAAAGDAEVAALTGLGWHALRRPLLRGALTDPSNELLFGAKVTRDRRRRLRRSASALQRKRAQAPSHDGNANLARSRAQSVRPLKIGARAVRAPPCAAATSLGAATLVRLAARAPRRSCAAPIGRAARIPLA